VVEKGLSCTFCSEEDYFGQTTAEYIALLYAFQVCLLFVVYNMNDLPMTAYWLVDIAYHILVDTLDF
jgi:hypothetical protein